MITCAKLLGVLAVAIALTPFLFLVFCPFALFWAFLAFGGLSAQGINQDFVWQNVRNESLMLFALLPAFSVGGRVGIKVFFEGGKGW